MRGVYGVFTRFHGRSRGDTGFLKGFQVRSKGVSGVSGMFQEVSWDFNGIPWGFRNIPGGDYSGFQVFSRRLQGFQGRLGIF